MKRTYHGSCHCKAVTFEADLDIEQGTAKCNCTMCWKQRMWTARVAAPGDFRLLTGADALSDYGKSGDWGEVHHRFCRTCGIATHGDGDIPVAGGVFLSVHLPALDDLPVETLVSAPVHLMDGLQDAWQDVPVEVRHL